MNQKCLCTGRVVGHLGSCWEGGEDDLELSVQRRDLRSDKEQNVEAVKKPQVDNSETAWGAKKGHRRLKYLMTISVKTRSLIYFFDEPELILHVLEKSRRTFSYRNEKHSYQNGPWKSWVPVQHSGHAWSTSATRSSRFITTVLVCVHLL